ncbi:hypothetical protein EV217_5134 [Phyllobacterium myrsinacearum]|uniref:hypothetical protein n=1 Tax=Phyllobacterium myrsinacearum TaxID=28101 RepID=UPI00102A230D|nr:hypothetical protein [Phyllobacterium myrsinacearum]RZS76902.1 hypothetical protein EV217_5134 [Phyllobacterium myrsinacearum]
MYTEDVYSKLKTWAEQGLFLLRELLPLMAPVGRYQRWKPPESQTLGDLLSASARSSESALLLVAYVQLWDAEILVRSVTEGSLKFCYLLQRREQFEERHRQYANDLFQIGLFKDHKKAAELLAAVPNPDDRIWKPIKDRLLSDAELTSIGSAFPSADRRSLDGRWGFTGLIGELARSGDKLTEGFTGFSHGYSMASHIHHADAIGTSIAMERDFRSTERRDAILLTHGARLICDTLSCFQLRLAVGYRFIQHDFAPISFAEKKIRELREAFDGVYEDWMNIEYPDTPPGSTRVPL